MAQQQIDGDNQIQNATITRAKILADFLAGSDLDITGGNNDATITGLANGANAADAVNFAQMNAAIAAAATGGMTYLGTIDASAITTQLDARTKGDFFLVSAAGTVDGKAFSIGDHMVVNADITDFSVDGAGKIDKIDNTESDDILRDTDVVNDLTTGGTAVPLSAQQGVVLKGLTDGNAKRIAERIFNEVPTVTDGSPILAALANLPVTAVTLRLYRNGMRMLEGSGNDYQLVAATGVVTFEYNLKTKDQVIADYEYVPQ
jgi:hypothetical protein